MDKNTNNAGEKTMNRNELIIRTSIVGIVTNILLVGFKMTVGLIASSISVVLDAVNNLTDAVSSIVTIIGTKLAGRKPDKKHPLGHGRIEYLAALIVAAIVIYAGINSAVESVKKISDPQNATYSVVSLVIIAVAVVVKIVLGTYVKKIGKKTNSGALEASGQDALFDAILSGSVLICAILNFITGIRLEAYVAIVISVFIMKAGLEMMTETLDYILGKREDPEFTKKIKEVICRSEEVRGAYDLIVTNYGPERYYASVHIELRDTMTVEEVDVLTRELERNVFLETGVILTGVGVYSYNTQNEEAGIIRNQISEIVLKNDWAIQMHGFHVDTEKKTMRFDVVLNFDITPKEGLEKLYAQVNAAYPDYTAMIVADVDVSD